MSIRVLVSRQFDVVSVEEAKSSFKSLIDAGWSVLVDASEAHPSPPAGAVASPPLPTKSRTLAARLIDEIVATHGVSLAEISRLAGVAPCTVSNYRAGTHGASKRILGRLRRLAKNGVAERRIVRRLSQDQLLDIALRRGSGESKAALAREFGISPRRVSRIVERLEA